jgi:ABC-type multidrug transport system fused ATPase/permease subunit
MTEKQIKMYEALKEMTAEEAVNKLLDYYGTQLLEDGFYEHLENEGVI